MTAFLLALAISLLLGLQGSLASWISGAVLVGATVILGLCVPGAFNPENLVHAGLVFAGFNLGLAGVLTLQVLRVPPAGSAPSP